MILGLSGRAGVGKDAVAEILKRNHGFSVIALADPMKRFAAEVFGFTHEQLWGPSAMRNAPDPRWDGLTPRKVLQHMGTEFGRAMHPDVWVRYAMSVARARVSSGTNVVITDVRFKNERAGIRAEGGLVWRVMRPGVSAGLAAASQAHASENDLTDDDAYDGALVNDGTLVDLAGSVSKSLIEIMFG